MRQLFLSLLAVVLLAGSTKAVTISSYTYEHNYWAAVTIDGSNKSVWAGAAYLDVLNGAQDIQAWCADLKHVIVAPWDATVGSSTPTVLDDNRHADMAMGVLWTNIFAANSSNADRSALQLAIWEALYDGIGIDLSDGRFKVNYVRDKSNIDAPSVITRANTFLNNWKNAGHIRVINGTVYLAPPPGSGTQSQDFILTPDTNFDPQILPETGTLVLTAVGLLCVGGALWRRIG